MGSLKGGRRLEEQPVVPGSEYALIEKWISQMVVNAS